MPEYSFTIPFPKVIENAYHRYGRELVPTIHDTLVDLEQSWLLGVKVLGLAARETDGLITTLTGSAPDHNIQHLIAVTDYATRFAVQNPPIRASEGRRSITNAIVIGSYLHDVAQQQAAAQILESGDNSKFKHAEIGALIVANLLIKHQQELGIDDTVVGLATSATYYHTSARYSHEHNADGQFKVPNLRDVLAELESLRERRPYLNRSLPGDLILPEYISTDPRRNIRIAVAQTVFWADEMTSLLPSDQALIRTVTTYPSRPLMSPHMQVEDLDPTGECDTDFGRILHEIGIQSDYMKMSPPAAVAPWLKEVLENRAKETELTLRRLRLGDMGVVSDLETKILDDLSSRLSDSEAYDALGAVVDTMEYVRQVLKGKMESIRALEESDFDRQLQLLRSVHECNAIRAVSSNGLLAKALRKPAPYRKVKMTF